VVGAGELDAASSPQLERALAEARQPGGPVELDLSKVSFIDSSGLRVITGVVRDVEADGGSFTITAASEAVRRIFEITGLRSLLPGQG
jgi:anti-sigma B factor antagonist